MDFKFAPRKNYAYLFFVMLSITLFSTIIFDGRIAGYVFVLSFYCLGVLQIRSNLVLDRSWTAKSEKDEGPVLFRVAIYVPFVVGTIGLLMLFLFPRR